MHAAQENVKSGSSWGGRHAVVVGGSLAGLLAAHVLAAHVDRVTVVERDRFSEAPEPRPGVPQSRHIHVLLEGGQTAQETLLPGFLQDSSSTASTSRSSRWSKSQGSSAALQTLIS